MSRSALGFITMAVLIFTTMGTADAEVMLKDDAIFGANSVILDTVNHKEFLPLHFTAPYSYAEVVNELIPGGQFDSWQVASAHDMNLLGASANIVYGSTDPAMVARAEQLRDWFGAVKTSSTHVYARGLVSDFFYPASYGGLIAQKAFSIGIKYDVSPVMVDY